MTAVYILFCIVAVFMFAHSVRFLKAYLFLKRKGNKTTGTITSFITHNNVLYKNTLIPKVVFYAENEKKIINTPRYSLFIELISYKENEYCDIYYKPANPDTFIIGNRMEFAINFISICLAIGYSVWLFHLLV
jgi:hypothetical protein